MNCFWELLHITDSYFVSHLSKYLNSSFLVRGTLMVLLLRAIWALRIIQSTDSGCRGLKLTYSHHPQICVPQPSLPCICWLSQETRKWENKPQCFVVAANWISTDWVLSNLEFSQRIKLWSQIYFCTFDRHLISTFAVVCSDKVPLLCLLRRSFRFVLNCKRCCSHQSLIHLYLSELTYLNLECAAL